MIRIAATFLAASVLSSCTTLTKEQRHIIAEAESLGLPPFKRDMIIKVFGLENIPSQRLGGSIRGGRMHFRESWMHDSGLLIRAYDMECVGDLKIMPGSIDSILNNPNGNNSNFAAESSLRTERKSFQEINILRNGKTIFQSKEYQGEQAASSNP